MQRVQMPMTMVVATVVLFLAMNTANEWIFSHSEFALGVNWVFLPAGIRLVSTLLFGMAGFIGLFISGLILNFYHFTFNDPGRAIGGAIAGSAGPYLVYWFAAQRYGLQSSLANLTPKRLMLLMLICSMASPLFHHMLFVFEGKTDHLIESYLAMFVGDLLGTIIVIYSAKGLLSLLPSAFSQRLPDDRARADDFFRTLFSMQART